MKASVPAVFFTDQSVRISRRSMSSRSPTWRKISRSWKRSFRRQTGSMWNSTLICSARSGLPTRRTDATCWSSSSRPYMCTMTTLTSSCTILATEGHEQRNSTVYPTGMCSNKIPKGPPKKDHPFRVVLFLLSLIGDSNGFGSEWGSSGAPEPNPDQAAARIRIPYAASNRRA